MNNKSLAMLSPLCIGLLAGDAWGALEPFSFGASESVVHESNLNHTGDDQAARVGDWISTTEFNAALKQDLGRDKLVANAAIDYEHYKRSRSLNGTGYLAAAEFDWSTIGDLSGALGADSHRRQYVYGETADPTGTGAAPQTVNVRNMQTDNHAFARVALGGDSRWTLFGGVDANQRSYSLASFNSDEERQWSSYAGTRYSTSPDLSFGLTGTYVRGEYPHARRALDTVPITFAEFAAKFDTRSLSATTRWQASGNSALDADLGYTTETSDLLSSGQKFISGSLNWTWTPPSHFTVNFGLKRSSDADTSGTGANVGVVNATNLGSTSINNVAHLAVTYALTAKIGLDASADYTQRKYADVIQLDSSHSNGATQTTRFYLTAHYQPTRTTQLSCGGGRENRHADAAIAKVLPAYSDNYLQCAASIHFE